MSSFEIFAYLIVFSSLIFLGCLMFPGKKQSDALKKELEDYYRKEAEKK